MASIPVTIKGTLTTKSTKGDVSESGQQDCLLVGRLHITGLAVGGGPIIPDDKPLPPGKPVFPIWGPPGIDLPDTPGFPPVATHPLPEPPPPFPEPPPGDIAKPPPP